MRHFRNLILAGLLWLSWTSASQAEIIVQYDLSGVPNSAVASVAASLQATGVTGLDLTRGTGIVATGLTNGFSANTWNGPKSLSEATDNNKYFQFGFTLGSGYTASLDTLDLSLRRSAVTAPMNMELQVSLDGFATAGTAVSSFTYFGRVSGTAPDPDPLLNDPFYYMTNDLAGRPNTTTSIGDAIPTVNLSNATNLQSLVAGSEVSFRLYAWGTTNTTSTNTLALGRIVGPSLYGTVTAVPEPASMSLVLGAIVAGACARRRRTVPRFQC